MIIDGTMAVRRTKMATPLRVQRSARVLGEHVTVARKLQQATAAQIAERAGISGRWSGVSEWE